MKRKQQQHSAIGESTKKTKFTTKLNKKKKKLNRQPKASDFYVVPWSDRSEWDIVCSNFNNGKYEEVIRMVTVWRERVPALPVGVETTSALLHALVGDSQEVSEDQRRSMYSLAIIRFLNHISHVATKESGENLPMFRMATHMSVPDWIVDLRHEISHGAALPSLETLRYAGEFIRTWLSQNYWIQFDGEAENTMLRTTEGPSKKESYEKISTAVSSFIAAKIYRLRGIKQITDPEITHQLPGQPHSVTTKQALGVVKTRITNFFSRTPSLVCSAIANEMIPTSEFLRGFCGILQLENIEDVFEIFCSLFAPLVELMFRRGKIPQMCTLMAGIHVEEVMSKEDKVLSALWLDHLLSKLEEVDKRYPLRLKKILALIMNNLDVSSIKFLPRLLRLLENKLGATRIGQLEALINIYTDDSAYENNGTLPTKIVTLEELTSRDQLVSDQLISDVNFQIATEGAKANWLFDSRGQNYWRQCPLGTSPDSLRV